MAQSFFRYFLINQLSQHQRGNVRSKDANAFNLFFCVTNVAEKQARAFVFDNFLMASLTFVKMEGTYMSRAPYGTH
jgi:hypothetical protein